MTTPITITTPTTTRTNKHSLLAGAVLLSLSAITFASNEVNSASIPTVNIPVIDNAQVFADFTDSMPAVLNYFTSATEEDIIDFYKQNFDEPISQEKKRERLTLTFQKEKQTIRVIISQQNNKRQVDVIIEQAQG